MSVVRRLPLRTRTPLQEAIVALRDVVIDARDALGDREYETFVSIGCDVLGLEAARLLFGELAREIRDAGRRAA